LPDDWHSAATAGVEIALLVVSAGFALIVWRTLLDSGPLREATSWFFLAGSGFFVLQAGVALYVAVFELTDDTRVLSYLPSSARIYLLLGGFVMAFVGGVSGRALPSMTGLPRSEKGAKLAAGALIGTVTPLAAGLLWLEYASFNALAVDLANACLAGVGLVFLALTYYSGVLRPEADRVRPASRPHMWLVRSAFLWLTFAAALSIYMGLKGLRDASLPPFLEVDAWRHAVGFGVATTLILGMSLMILPEFAAERMTRPDQSMRSYTLLTTVNLAALLRVGSSLFADKIDSETRQLFVAMAGILAEAALLLFALSVFRLMAAARRRLT
jgi:hypothetical protein